MTITKPRFRINKRGWFRFGGCYRTGSTDWKTRRHIPTIGMDGRELPEWVQIWVGPYPTIDQAFRAITPFVTERNSAHHTSDVRNTGHGKTH